MDYRKILKCYIELVGAAEGVDFLTHERGYAIDGLTIEETEELIRIAEEDGYFGEMAFPKKA